MKFFHGTKEGKVNFGDCARFGTCFTDDRFIAYEYAERVTNGGDFIDEEEYDDEMVRCYTVEIDVEAIADEDDAREVMKAAGIEPAGTHIWEDFDRHQVREAIAEAGFDAVSYDDDSPTGTTHKTIRAVADVDVEIVEEEIMEPGW